ncbi:MAG: hypothetical protein KBT27_08180, partial [Prevotellaceae bacterium]|nr:hypothetical protein [Candidatus Faecinaster equi]
MKKNIKILLFVVCVFILSSCATPYIIQVYDVKSDLKEEDNYLVFSNGDCRIMYNLWQEQGNLSFVIDNIADKELYLSLNESFFIYNGFAENYYCDSYKMKKPNIPVLIELIAVNQNWMQVKLSDIFREPIQPEFICIPPHTKKIVCSFNISNYIYKDCDNYAQNYPE